MALRQCLVEAHDVVVGPRGPGHQAAEVAAGQVRGLGPVVLAPPQQRAEQVGRFFGQLAEGGDLAAPHVQQRRAAGGVEVQLVVACHRRSVARVVVQQRAHAGITPHHVGSDHRAGEVAAGLLAQVAHLVGADAGLLGCAVLLDVGGAHQGEVAFVGDGEDDALVGVLEDVGVVVLEELLHDDVAALHQPQRPGLRLAHLHGQELRGPGSGGVDQHAGLHAQRGPALGLQRGLPAAAGTFTAHGLRAGAARQHGGAALGGVHGVQHNQPGVVHPAVAVDEAARVLRLQRGARRVLAQLHRGRARQPFAAGQVVVQEQPGADHPHRPHRRVVRHHEAQRPHDVRRTAQQPLALGQRLAHEAELVVLEVAQATVDELGARRRGVRRQVVLLAQQHPQATARQVARDAGAVDAAAHHQHVGVDGGGFGIRHFGSFVIVCVRFSPKRGPLQGKVARAGCDKLSRQGGPGPGVLAGSHRLNPYESAAISSGSRGGPATRPAARQQEST